MHNLINNIKLLEYKIPSPLKKISQNLYSKQIEDYLKVLTRHHLPKGKSFHVYSSFK